MITIDTVKKDLEEIVAEVGEDYVYPESEKVHPSWALSGICQYVYNDKPSCIIGRWAFKNGVTIDQLKAVENQNAQKVFENYFPDVPIEIQWLMLHIQQDQDNGGSWGEIVKRNFNTLN